MSLFAYGSGGYMSGGKGQPYMYLKSKKKGKGAFKTFRKAHYASRSYNPEFGYAPQNTNRYRYAMFVKHHLLGTVAGSRAQARENLKAVAAQWRALKNQPAVKREPVGKGSGFRRRRR